MTITQEQFDSMKNELTSANAKIKEHSDKNAELMTKLTEATTKLTDIETQKETDKGNFKSLYETEKTKVSGLEKRLNDFKGAVEHNEKHKAITAKLVESGLRKDALGMLDKEDLSAVKIEHTSEGRMIPQGVDDWVDGFKKRFAFAFEEKKPTKVNGGGGGNGEGGGGDDDMTGAKLFAIEKKHGRNSDEYKKGYEALLKKKTKK